MRCNVQLLRACLVTADRLGSICSILAFQHLGFLLVGLLQAQAAAHTAQPHAADHGHTFENLQPHGTIP